MPWKGSAKAKSYFPTLPLSTCFIEGKQNTHTHTTILGMILAERILDNTIRILYMFLDQAAPLFKSVFAYDEHLNRKNY